MFSWVVGAITLIAMAFVAPVLGVLFGAFGAWVIGLFFGDLILRFLAEFGIEGFAMWQIGACLGFVGGYFKSHHIERSRN